MHIVGGGIPPSPPRIFNGGGDAHRVKGDAHPSLPYEHPSPPYVPVTPYEQLKFPRVINPDSPLNDSRQLDWVKPVGLALFDIPNSNRLMNVRIAHLRIAHWGAILRWAILSPSVIRIAHPNY